MYVVTTDPASFHAVRSALGAKGITPTESELAMVPRNTVPVTGEAVAQLFKLIESLEDLDDVQKVWANFEVDDAELDGRPQTAARDQRRFFVRRVPDGVGREVGDHPLQQSGIREQLGQAVGHGRVNRATSGAQVIERP